MARRERRGSWGSKLRGRVKFPTGKDEDKRNLGPAEVGAAETVVVSVCPSARRRDVLRPFPQATVGWAVRFSPGAAPAGGGGGCGARELRARWESRAHWQPDAAGRAGVGGRRGAGRQSGSPWGIEETEVLVKRADVVGIRN